MKRGFVILMAAVVLAAGCAKAPVKEVAVEKNTDQLAEIATIGLEPVAPASESTTAPEAKTPDPVSPLYEKLGAPMRYEVTLTPDTDKLVITVDADVYLPNANGVPTVRVSARDFTQDEVTRLFQAFCGDTVMYKNRTQSTRAEIQEHIREFEEELKTATGARKEKVEDNIAYYKRDLAAAPETIVDEVCDGTLTEKQLGVQEYLGKYMSVTARETPETPTEGKSFSARNNTYAHNTKSDYDFSIGASLGYSGKPRQARLLDVNPYVFIKDESAVPTEALGELNTTPAEARALVEAFWAENGFSDMHVSAVWLADNRESEHLKLNGDSYGEKHAYLVACGQDINGVIPRTNDAIWDGMRWRYESCMFVVSDMGIERFGWSSPHAYEEIVTSDTQMLPFERIDEIFRKMMLVKYESITHGNAGAKLFTYQIDRVALELQRISEQGSADTGLLVPVWNFYGTFHYTYTDGAAHGSEIVQGLPTPLLSINAIDGSIIDESQGY